MVKSKDIKKEKLSQMLIAEFHSYYPPEKLAKDPLMCLEALGFLRCLSLHYDCMDNWTQFETALLYNLLTLISHDFNTKDEKES